MVSFLARLAASIEVASNKLAESLTLWVGPSASLEGIGGSARHNLTYVQCHNSPVQAQRALKASDAEKTDAQDRVNELTSSTSSLQSAKRKAEQQLATLQEEYEDMETEARENGEKLRKAMEQNARLQSEQMTTRDQLSTLEKAKVCTQTVAWMYANKHVSHCLGVK